MAHCKPVELGVSKRITHTVLEARDKRGREKITFYNSTWRTTWHHVWRTCVQMRVGTAGSGMSTVNVIMRRIARDRDKIF